MGRQADVPALDRRDHRQGWIRRRQDYRRRALRHARRRAGAFRGARVDGGSDSGREVPPAGRAHRPVEAGRAERRLSRDGRRHHGVRSARGRHPVRSDRLDGDRLGSILVRPGPLHEREGRREALPWPDCGGGDVSRARQACRGDWHRHAEHRSRSVDDVRSPSRQHVAQRLPHRERRAFDDAARVGVQVVVAPINIAGGSGGPARVFAFLK